MTHPTQRGFAILPAIFIVIALMAAAGVGYVLIKQPFAEETATNDTADVVVTNINSTDLNVNAAVNVSSTVNSNTSTSANIFSFENSKVGDHVADMTIIKKGQFVLGTNAPINRQVSFSGRTTVTGIYANTSIFGYELAELTKESVSNIPILNDDERTVWFKFTNQAEVQSTLGTLPINGEGRRVTVVIDEYTINHYEAGVGNSAKFISVVDANLTADWKTYLNSKYSFKYPDTYSLKEVGTTATVIRVWPANLPDYGATHTLRVSILDSTTKTPEGNIYAWARAGFPVASAPSGYSKSKEVSINGQTATVVSVASGVDTVLEYFIAKGDFSSADEFIRIYDSRLGKLSEGNNDQILATFTLTK